MSKQVVTDFAPAPLLKSPAQLDSMREAGRIVAKAMAATIAAIKPGVTTAQLDAVAHDFIVAQGAKPAFLGLYDFPATACISLNHEIVHGLPDDSVVRDGDLVSIDCGAIVDGMYSDMARTVAVGKGDEVKNNLVQCAKKALANGIKQAVGGNHIGDISNAVESYATKGGYQVVREYVGHGIGSSLHESPAVPNFGEVGGGPLLMVGMVLAIEPMLTVGGWQTKLHSDGWTVETADGQLSAHFEDTVAITADGPEVLTTGN